MLNVNTRNKLSQRGSAKSMAKSKNRNKSHKEGAELSFIYSVDVYYRSVRCNENEQDRLDSLF